MVLVDTSVWIEHFRVGEPGLAKLLTDTKVLMHPFITGELACGNLKNRAAIFSKLVAMPVAKVASHHEVFRMVEDRRIFGKGIGWVDSHLLASALLTGCGFWTLDGRLRQTAGELGILSAQ